MSRPDPKGVTEVVVATGVSDAGQADFIALQQALAGRYSLRREIGRGGMGIVFLARDVALDRLVAIKLLPPALSINPDLRKRFLQEARTAAKLSHPYIVPIHSVEEHGDLVFFVMAFVDGESLGERVRRRGPLPIDEATRIFQEISWAVAYSHQHGIIHRDIKPDNILIDKATGRAVVTDFGIARVADSATATATGMILGTIRYMSPEQATGGPIDHRSDLYSLGVTAFFALTGRLPFDAPTAAGTLALQLTQSAPPVTTLRDDVPHELARAVDRCLIQDPNERFSSGEELSAAIAVSSRHAPVAQQIVNVVRAARQVGTTIGSTALIVFYVVIFMESLEGIWGVALILALFWVEGLTGVGRAAKKALTDGFSFDDVRSALLREAKEEAERRGVGLQVTSGSNRERWMVRILGSVFTLSGLLIAVRALSSTSSAGDVLVGLGGVGLALAGVGLVGLVSKRSWGLRIRGMLTPGPPEAGTDVWSRYQPNLFTLLMAGWLGRAIFAIAGRGMGNKAGPAAAAPDPAEIVIGKAAADLFEDIPQELRLRFPSVPSLIERLEKHAGALRHREGDLAKALADVGTAGPSGGLPGADIADRKASAAAELEAARDRVIDRLAVTVAALEAIRLDLLRLRAGVGTVDDLTGDVERAQQLGDEVDAELEGMRVVDQGFAS